MSIYIYCNMRSIQSTLFGLFTILGHRPTQHQLYYSIGGINGILMHHILRHLYAKIEYQFQMPQDLGLGRLVMSVLIKLLPEKMIVVYVPFQKRNMSKGMKWDKH